MSKLIHILYAFRNTFNELVVAFINSPFKTAASLGEECPDLESVEKMTANEVSCFQKNFFIIFNREKRLYNSIIGPSSLHIPTL